MVGLLLACYNLLPLIFRLLFFIIFYFLFPFYKMLFIIMYYYCFDFIFTNAKCTIYFINEWSHKLLCNVRSLFTIHLFFCFSLLFVTFLHFSNNTQLSYILLLLFLFLISRGLESINQNSTNKVRILLYAAQIQSFDLFVAIKTKRQKGNNNNNNNQKWNEWVTRTGGSTYLVGGWC